MKAARSLIAAMIVLIIAAAGSVSLLLQTKTATAGTSPFQGVKLYADPASQAAVAVETAEPQSPHRMQVLERLARVPQAIWFGNWIPSSTVTGKVQEIVKAAALSNAVPLFVVYDLPHRDCGQESAGGAADAADYRSWILAFAAGIGQSKAFVILEPDGLAQLNCLSGAAQSKRLELLRFAGAALSAYPNIVTYLDAGHAAWIAPKEMAKRLRVAGVGALQGFSTNVSYYNTTEKELAYAKAVSALIGGMPYVIDTSRNGRGAIPGGSNWCNPPGRALGQPPLHAKSAKGLDALLWVKAPGVSDGVCGRREPAAGVFWPQRAWELATAAGW